MSAPGPGPIELQQTVLTSAYACALATVKAVQQAQTAAFNDKDMQQAGSLAATAAQCAAATRDLTEALMTLQRGPVKAIGGTPPALYP